MAGGTKAVDLVTGKAKVEYYFDPTLVLDEEGNDDSVSGSGTSSSVGITPRKTRKQLSGISRSGSSSGTNDEVLYKSEYLFYPCSILKKLDHVTKYPNAVLVKTSEGGALHKIRDSTKLIEVKPLDRTGACDVLQLSDVSEPSLLHTLRLRYKRDDIYTSTGPILISINPYKPIDGYYSIERMHQYRDYRIQQQQHNPFGSATSTPGAGSSGSTMSSSLQLASPAGGSGNAALLVSPSSATTMNGSTNGRTPSSSIVKANGTIEPHLFQVADRAYAALMDLRVGHHPSKAATSARSLDSELEQEQGSQKSTTGGGLDQSIIISGESGAGKTEATKYILQYLARITSEADPKHDTHAVLGKNHSTMEDRVLSANPLLESFGNARTLRNDNSSRFGKFIQVQFHNTTGIIGGASISNYLLEKTRITQQVDGERNYHIFYQLITGGSTELLEPLHLTKSKLKGFNYISFPKQPSRRDIGAFEETTKCLTNIGIDTPEAQQTLFGVVSAVLFLGNIDFQEGGTASSDGDDAASSPVSSRTTSDGSCSISTRDALEKACQLLGLEPDDVESAMIMRQITIGGKTISKPQSIPQAQDKRDALSKLVYSSLFQWLVDQINKTIQNDSSSQEEDDEALGTKFSGDDDAILPSDSFDGFSPDPSSTKRRVSSLKTKNDIRGFIGVLDIYGFEHFDVNGFEQLLINYANENMQRHFNKHLFEVEQDIYSNEGVDWTYITFNDNRPCLELLEGGGSSSKVGILSTLDDAWGGMGTANEKDVKFVSQLHQTFGGTPKPKHEYFVTPKFGSDRQFGIHHYAGEVRYTANGFVEKNMESLSNELKDLGGKSTIAFVRDIFQASNPNPKEPPSPAVLASTSTSTNGSSDGMGGSGSSGPSRRSTIRGTSVSAQFRMSLQKLVADLEQTSPHFIRCIKPNGLKQPNNFESGDVLRQLRYAGMMETIRIRQQGYSVREDHETFYQTYCIVLLQSHERQKMGIEYLVQTLSEQLGVTEADWQIGHSKIFLRRELANKLSALANLRVRSAARTLGRFGRWVAKQRALRLLTPWLQYRYYKLRQYKQRNAATRLSSVIRMNKERVVYQKQRSAMISIQCLIRLARAKNTLRLLRDPYVDMSFQEVSDLYQQTQEALEDAINKKQFQKAADMEVTLKGMKEALESKRPLTRAVIDQMIDEIQIEIDDALQAKNYSACAPLQEKMDVWLAKKQDFPTLEELKEAVTKAEEAVAECAAQRNFAKAAELQTALDEARVRYEQEYKAQHPEEETNEHNAEGSNDVGDGNDAPTNDEKNGTSDKLFSCRGELEQEISKLTKEVEELVNTKQFGVAEERQQELTKLELLRTDYPSLSELQTQLADLTKEMDDAIAQKKFSVAGQLHDQIDSLQQKIDEEKAALANLDGGENATNTTDGDASNTTSGESPETSNDDNSPKFTSRAELEAEISKLSKEVEEAAAQKDFEGAKVKHDQVDALEVLRSQYPTALELETMVNDHKTKMDDAVASKNFALAKDLNETIESLEAKLAVEKEKEATLKPEEPSPPTSTPAAKKGSAKTNNNATPKTKNTTTTATQLKKMSATGSKKTPSVTATPATLRAESSIKSAPNNVGASTRGTVSRQMSSMSAAASVISTNSAMSTTRKKGGIINPAGVATSTSKTDVDARPVSKLRPKKPLLSSVEDNVLSVVQMLATKRGDASLIADSNGGLAGIITDTDVTRRLVAKHLDSFTTQVSDIMTPHPTCVSLQDSAMEALSIMVENHFRHLPVLDDKGAIVGLLDIAKCLNDAISKLEKANAKSKTDAEKAVQQMAGLQGVATEGTQAAAALQLLLSPLMAQAFGNQASPTLRSLLASKPKTLVGSHATIREAGILMAESRKAALIVDDGELVGIFGFKDMMIRAIAKQLPIDETEVGEVMTPHPESVSPDITVVEALQVMHDNKFLTLPVCEEDGTVVGLVDVMDLIYSCGGSDGWRSIFGSAMECDDGSDTSSVGSRGSRARSVKSALSSKSNKSSTSAPAKSVRMKGAAGNRSMLDPLEEKLDERPVSKLRPKKPLISHMTDSVLDVTKMLASKRGDATIISSEEGGLAGILTDTDITRRVVAQELDPQETDVSQVMTPEPKCVAMSDSAIDALTIMVENHFRHLPVLNDNGAIVGLLDIAKCLNDALSKLEKAHEKGKLAADDLVKQMATAQGAGAQQAAAFQALLGPLMSQAFGGSTSPTLRSLLGRRPATMVRPTDDLAHCGKLMAESRKAALVVDDDGTLVGLFGFKDMMTRAVAKELLLSDTQVSEVMTTDPESVSPDMTVVEALQVMHDQKFLTLPVCEVNGGAVVGLVDVMDLIYGCGGAQGWKSIFSRAMETNADDDDDDESDARSWRSNGSAIKSIKSQRSSRSKKSITSNISKKKQQGVAERPVSKLRPKKPLVSSVDDTVLSVTQMLASKRGDASLIASNDGGGLAGIITDTDITRRLVAKHLDASTTNVTAIMTPNPSCVSMNDSAMDALGIMVENHFRHLPVLDEDGSIVGLLDIAKCLNDAISKLEKAKDKSQSAAEDAVKQMASLQAGGGGQAHAAALQMLLGPLMAQAFGGSSSPTLRSILASKPKTMISSDTSIQRAGELMAESRKAALVVDDGELVGIFGFKDMMTRAIAKELPIDETEVAEVMTPHPESVSPDMTVVEALQVMHDNKFLTLPVCEEDGTVVGLVDVMDLIYSCGGAEGWRSVFGKAMDATDDLSDDDATSVYSSGSMLRSVKSKSKTTNPVSNKDRSVSKLRPSKPLVADKEDTVLEVCQMMKAKRGRASLLSSDEGGLAGILTDHDVVRRVVAKDVDPSTTSASAVMTKDPMCVHMADSAMEALTTMIENHYRYLPVLDNDDAIVGLLDIGKVLNDAITKLERKYEKNHTAAEDAMEEKLAELHGVSGAHAEALKMLLKPMMAQAFGGVASPTLGSLLASGKKRTSMVHPETSVREASIQMSETHKAVLVVDDDGALSGIVSFKDVMSRALAEELSFDETTVEDIMTSEPEHVSPETTVVEAMQIMHDNKFLTLPVCEDDGTVLGVVDVMDLIYGCGGADGWRSIFDSAMDAADDMSEAGRSTKSGVSFSKSVKSLKSTKSKSRRSKTTSKSTKQDDRPVSKLRPSKPLISSQSETILEVCQMLAKKRGRASLIAAKNGGLAGILTDHDVVRRVVAKEIDAASTSVTKVMTRNPMCVEMNDSAMEALMTMIENHYRYLPVLDDDTQAIVGLLDIGKVLNDAITKLERTYEKSHNTAETAMQAELLKNLHGVDAAHAEALKMLLKPMMAQAFGGNASPTLGSLLVGKRTSFVDPDTTVLEAAIQMADTHKAALVVDEDGDLLGIVSFKDVMTRALAKELPMDETPVSDIMTSNPEHVSPETTVVEAMQIMHDHKFLTLPVCKEDDDGTVSIVGVVDVMDLIYGCGGAEGWRSIFDSAMDADDATDAQSDDVDESVVRSLRVTSIKPGGRGGGAGLLKVDKPLMYQEPKPIESIEFRATEGGVGDEASFHGSIISDIRSSRVPPKYETPGGVDMDRDLGSGSLGMSMEQQSFVYKVVDANGNTHRITCEPRYDKLVKMVAAKLGTDVDPSTLQLKFFDDEGDTVLISGDDDLVDAIEVTKKAGVNALKLSVSIVSSTSGAAAGKGVDASDNTMMMGIGAGVVLVVLAAAFMLTRPKK